MTGEPKTTIATKRGIAAGRDVVGILPEQLPALIAAANAALERQTSEQRAEIGALSFRLGASEGILRTVLVTLGEHADTIPLEALPAKVAELVRERQELLARQRDRPDDRDAAMAELDRALAEAMAAGDDPRTRSLLLKKRDLKLTAAAHRADAAERLRAAEHSDLREAAESEATLGSLALASLRYRDAATHFHAAAGILPLDDGDSKARLAYLDRAADALYRQGSEFGDNAALLEAIDNYQALATHRPRNDAPLDWATTQSNLGAALRTLGERESGGTARLEEAVVAYRAALEEHTRDRVPLDWATTQNNLGNALETLGERESGSARLEEAVAAHRAALEERTRDRVPLDWATTQNNLGNALQTLGMRESGTARLEEAVAAYRAALEERTRDRVPLNWATTQNNLGAALSTLGERESGTARLEEAVAAYRAALGERTRDRVPLDWAATQNNLGNALATLGERESGTARLEEAVAAYRAALEEYTRDRAPLDWAMSTGNQGGALMLMAERTSDVAMARRARDQIATAAATMREGGHEPNAAYFAGRLPAAEALVARLAKRS